MLRRVDRWGSRLMGRCLSKPVIAGLATMPSRSHTLPKAIASVIHQVDRLYLYLDGFSSIPEIAKSDPRIVPIMSDLFPRLHSDGKFVGLILEERYSCYYLSVDDDISYPATYVDTLVEVVDRHKGRAVAGVHGTILTPPVSSYLVNRICYNFGKSLNAEIFVDVQGCGTTLFDANYLRFDVRDWQYRNVNDLMLAIEAENRGIRRVLIKRKDNYLKAIEEKQPDSLFAKAIEDNSLQTMLANQLLAIQGRACFAEVCG